MSEGTVEIRTTLSMKVTDLAKAKLAQFLGPDRKIDEFGVRVGVAPGGCSGASYNMEFAGAPQGNETTLISNGVRVFFDPAHAAMLNGLTVDFVDELMGGGFKIHNPNATSSCGCGKSFSV